jgi:LacI family transcriptional regulator
MGYVPNLTARALSTQKSHLIGIIYRELYRLRAFRSPFFPDVLGSFNQVMETEGYDLLFLSPNMGKWRIIHPEHGNYRNIDGILFINISQKDKDYDHLINCGLPRVSANDIIPGICAVVTANYEGAKTAVQYLIDLGHRRIAYIKGPVSKTSPAAMERLRGYRDCLKQNRISWEPALIEDAKTWLFQSGYEATKRLFSRTHDFTSIFASNDTLAYGIMRAVKEESLKIPRDISIIGFDGDELGGYITPALTTMRQNAVMIGQIAGQMMLKELTGEKQTGITTIPADLLIRDSCRRIRPRPAL